MAAEKEAGQMRTVERGMKEQGWTSKVLKKHATVTIFGCDTNM